MSKMSHGDGNGVVGMVMVMVLNSNDKAMSPHSLYNIYFVVASALQLLFSDQFASIPYENTLLYIATGMNSSMMVSIMFLC